VKLLPTEFEGHSIRRTYDEATETWWFSVVDVVQVLTQQIDDLTARKYWNQLKRRLQKEGSQLVTSCHQLKMQAADGKQRLTDVATAQTLLRLVQSIPSPKAEPIKLWLAKVGHERMQEMADPALSLNRAHHTWQQHGRSEKWIQQRMAGQETRNKLTDYWRGHKIKEGQEFAILTNIIHQEWSGVEWRQRQGPQEAQEPEEPQPARSHDRGRTDLHCAGGTFDATDCRESWRHRHACQQSGRAGWWRHFQAGAPAAGEPDRKACGVWRELSGIAVEEDPEATAEAMTPQPAERMDR
jgi:hypothetical protein